MRNKLLLMLLVVLLLVPFSVNAQEDPGTPSRTITGAMVVDCDSLTGEALDYAREVGICSEFTTFGSGSNTGSVKTLKHLVIIRAC